MDMTQYDLEMAKIPQDAVTRPLWLANRAMLVQLDQKTPGASSEQVAAMRQELDALKSPPLPSHPPGLCQESSCVPCVTQGQAMVALGRGAVQADIDTALEWFGGSGLQERIAVIVGKWLSAGRPQPTSDPYLVISPE